MAKLFSSLTGVGAEESTPPPPWIKRVALVTGVLAALAGFLAVRSTNLANDAIYRSNQGVLFQAQASDTWAEYQAASIKARLVETQLAAGSAGNAQTAATLKSESDALRDRQPALHDRALELEKKRDEQLQSGTRRLLERDLLGYAGVAIQLAIALASVSALTRQRPIFLISILIGLSGAAITAYALVAYRFVHG